MSLEEWIEIKATLHSIEEDRFNCTKCLSKYKGRADEEQMLAKVRANMGCQEMKGEAIHKIGDSLSFRSCIGNFAKPQVHALIQSHYRFERGILPYPGGLHDQPAKILEVFQAITVDRSERAERERAKAERAARGKGGKRV